MIDLIQNGIIGTTAGKIASSVEDAVMAGRLERGCVLPPVRKAAADLGVSPGTVAAAYSVLRDRGIVITDGRRGTRISPRRPVGGMRDAPLPPGVRDLEDGNPDPDLLPPMKRALTEVDPSPWMYGGVTIDPVLDGMIREDFAADGIPAARINVTRGSFDAIDRMVREHLRPGDRVAVEDPGYGSFYELLANASVLTEPVEVDPDGMRPESLASALRKGVRALICVPRGQNPTGATVSADRAEELRAVLRKHPDVLVIEDDHMSRVTESPYRSLVTPDLPRWVVIRSFSKAINADLRIAAVAGDERTMAVLEDRLAVAYAWVPHLIQRIVGHMLADAEVRACFDRAIGAYAERRGALLRELAARGIGAFEARTGFNIWIPTPGEASVVRSLAACGWGVRAGERHRLASGPGVRVTVSRLLPEEAPAFADALKTALSPGRVRCGSA